MKNREWNDFHEEAFESLPLISEPAIFNSAMVGWGEKEGVGVGEKTHGGWFERLCEKRIRLPVPKL